jgi:hypothetical protein
MLGGPLERFRIRQTMRKGGIHETTHCGSRSDGTVDRTDRDTGSSGSGEARSASAVPLT